MSRSQSPINSILVVVVLLAVAGGLAIVIVTSPQSWAFGPAAWIQALVTTPTHVPTAGAATATPTSVATMATASPTARATGRAPVTATFMPTDTPFAPTPGVTPTVTLPPDVTALAVVVVQNAGSARVRNEPGGDTVVAAVPGGTPVQVLGGRVEFNNVVWLQVRLPGGQVGWIADFLIRVTQTFA